MVCVRCKVCQEDTARSQVEPDGRWVHVLDYVTLDDVRQGKKSNYDHPAEPDFIEVTGTEIPG